MDGESISREGATPEESAIERGENAIDGVETAPPGVIAMAFDALRLRDRAFVAAVGRSDLTVPTLVIAGLAILTTSLAGWLYLKFDDFGAVDAGRILFREVIAGSVFMFALWLAWILIAEALLRRRGFDVDRGALIRSMGLACTPLLVSLLMIIPILSFGVALITMAVWVVASDMAIAAAVPAASASERNVANLAGFGLLAVVLGGIAFQTGMAPGPFVFVGLWELVR